MNVGSRDVTRLVDRVVELAAPEKVVLFGKKNFAIVDLKGGAELGGSYTSLNGFRSADLRSADPDRITRHFPAH